MHTAWNEIITCSFRCAADKIRRLDIEEAFSVHEFMDERDQAAPEHDLLLELRTAEIKIAIAEAKVFPRVNSVKHVERRCLGFAEDSKRIARDFHRSCLQICIGSSFSLPHSPCDRDAVLAVQRCRFLISFKDDLHDAGTVSQINKDNTALIAALCDPSHECHLFSDHILCDLAAPCCAYETLH